jgi:DNA mismatch repair protein MutS2
LEVLKLNKNTIKVLEYDRIKEILKTYALSDMAKEMIESLEPYIDVNVIERHMKETSEARAISNRSTSIPINSLTGIRFIKNKLAKQSNLLPEELESISGLLREGNKLKKFMEGKEYEAPLISSYALSIYALDEVVNEIERCIVQGRVIDKASSELGKLRKKILVMEDRIKSKLDNVLRNPKYKNILQENLVSQRNGRYVIPIISQYKNELQGNIQDSSSSGATVFIEPLEVKRAQDELNLLKVEEDKEVYRILSILTVLVEDHEREIFINVETMVYYDFLFAKAKYSKAVDGKSVKFNVKNHIKINKGKHPLIGRSAVPLDFVIGEDFTSLVITGPNTGGKTVVLKTVALLTMMAQSGLHVPVEEGSEFAVFADVLVDIGDGQSIEQNLSTFSSHIKNIISIMECTDKFTLVIMDEVGAGTDPGEGMGLATAVLEEVNKKGSIMIATTHYSEIKDFADNTSGFKNGCMEFDMNTLKPNYRLKIGEAGESNAFLIALRLGMDKRIIERAHKITYKENMMYSDYDKKIIDDKIIDKDTLFNHEESIKMLGAVEMLRKISEKQKKELRFKLGDCVYISSMNRAGIVCELENSKGDVVVMIMRKKFKVNHKRLTLYIEKKELYPENYDLDIAFETKENRKKKHLMNRMHIEGIKIEKSVKDANS